ncbi:hypothetical protein P389DRAFT_187284 [Cystobasidium minutum MCA 4210]|uniref:uncharacterized protein n=1 Tax=Cystobasidium minutum MCA 4210 TaxID=1397322 RepID=UPI0034CD1D97|eukprot:jgi/Rhomi1/187284/estExt_fgenesh1_pg.C_1_t20079
MSTTDKAAYQADKAVGKVAAVGMGQKTPVGEMTHPIHPATVHFPIGLWTASFGLNVLNHFTPGVFPSSATSTGGLLARFVPPASSVPMMAHYLNGAGLLFSTVTIATGVSELMGMWRGQAEKKGGYMNALKDAYTSDENDIAANKLKTTITHATLNDAVFGLAAYNFYKQATLPNFALPAGAAWMSAAVMPLFFYSAYLGGKLVYEYGVGVQRQGQGPEIAKMQKEQ